MLATKQEREDAALARQGLSRERWRDAGSEVVDFLSLVTAMSADGEDLDLRDLMFLQTKSAPIPDVIAVPPGVTNMFHAIVETQQCQAVFDPVAGFGMHTEWLAEHLVATKFEARGDASFREAMSNSADHLNYRFRRAGSRAPRGGRTQYDAVITVISAPADPRSPFRLVVEHAADVIDDGLFAIVVPPLFSYEKRSDFMDDSFENSGFSLSAVLTCPPQTFEHSDLAYEMLVFDKQRQAQLFVAGIPDDPDEQRDLVARLIQRRRGATARVGALVERDSFINLHALASTQHYERLGVESRATPRAFDIAIRSATGVMWADLKNHAFDAPESTVLVPANDAEEALWVGAPDFVPPDDGPADHRSDRYLVLETRDDVTSARFLSLWLNSPLGGALRSAALLQGPSIGATIGLLRQLPLYIPGRADQQTMIEATEQLERLTRDVNEAKARFWRLPFEPAIVRDDISELNHSDRQLTWINTLPYPLAAILEAYRFVDSTDSSKAERLKNFFHAFAVFLASVQLGAFRSKPERWLLAKDRIVKLWKRGRRPLRQPSMGDWVGIAAKLAAEVRETEADSHENRSLLACRQSRPAIALSSDKIAPLLDGMAKVRNEGAHGGNATTRDDTARLTKLEDGLRQLQGIVGRLFADYQLVIAGSANVVAESRLDMELRSAVGSNQHFSSMRAQLSSWPTTGSLYMHELGNDMTLPLLPFLSIEPRESRAYFFNGIREDGMFRWVCYQLDRDSEHASEVFMPPDEHIRSVVDELVGER